MRFLTKNRISSLSSSGSTLSSDYGVSNLLDSKPGHRWISNASFDEISMTCGGGSSSFFLGNVSADFGTYRRCYPAKSITAITQANPGVLTSTGHGFSEGDPVWVSGISGMYPLNDQSFTIYSPTTNTFSLKDSSGNVVNTSSFGTYSSGGGVAKIVDTGTLKFRVITSYYDYFIARVSTFKQCWEDVSYVTESTQLFLKLVASIDHRGDIAAWSSAGGNALGHFTDGSSTISINPFTSSIGIGSMVFFSQTTATDVRQISRDGSTNNVKLTLNSNHVFANGDRILVDNILISGVPFELNDQIFTVTNKTSTTVDLSGTSNKNVTLVSSASDIGSLSKAHQITQIVGDGSSASGVTLSPSPASNAAITTSATVSKILYGVSAGVLRAGRVESYSNPQEGFSDALQSFSVREETGNGGMYLRNRKNVRTPSFNVQLLNEDYQRFFAMIREIDAEPFACLIFDNYGLSSQNCGFFSLAEPPQGTFASRSTRTLQIKLREIP